MVSSDIAKVVTNYTYDTLGNLVLETSKNKSVDYEYNELNQLVKKTTSQNEVFTYTYDARGNRTAETGKKASQSFVYDATNRLVEGTNWKGDKSAYTYNGLGLRVNNLVTTHAGKTYDRDYVIDYTSPENDDLYVYAMGNGQLEYEQRHVYAGSERLEQITEKGNGGWERTLYVHEDVMGNTRYYTKATGQNFAELQYDAWGQPISPNKLVNNDHGNYVFATFTGHIYDPVLDIYFAEARFYDSTNRTWMTMDPIKDGLNWYQYCLSNPTTNWDPTGLSVSLVVTFIAANPEMAAAALLAVGVLGKGLLDAAEPLLAEIPNALRNAIQAVDSYYPNYDGCANGQEDGTSSKQDSEESNPTNDNDNSEGAVSSGKARAPKTGEPGSTYEQLDDNGNVRSRTKYGDNGKPEYRDDLTGRPHYDKKTGQYLEQHRHNYTYNENGQPTGESVTPIPD